MRFVFHGGSGSSSEDIQCAIEAGVIKMNIDTDTQWAFWDGIRAYEAKNHDYLQGQVTELSVGTTYNTTFLNNERTTKHVLFP